MLEVTKPSQHSHCYMSCFSHSALGSLAEHLRDHLVTDINPKLHPHPQASVVSTSFLASIYTSEFLAASKEMIPDKVGTCKHIYKKDIKSSQNPQENEVLGFK